MMHNNAQQSDVGAAFRRPSGVPIRKPNRLKDYDYSHYGAYFVTICAKDNLDLFASIDTVAGAASCRPSLTATGKIIENEIKKLSHTYKDVIVEHHVIMPNHVHMIIFIDAAEKNGRQDAAPTVSRTIGQWKRAVSIKAGRSVWQKSFYDRVIRNEKEYRTIAEYIENNPQRWKEDKYYPQGRHSAARNS